MKLTMFKLLYKVTKNRKWVIKYIDMFDKLIRRQIEEARNELA